MDMGTSSLREKFKLLRQWQMQQQEEFERIKLEHSVKSSNYDDIVNDKLSNSIRISNDNREVEDVKDTENDGGHSLGFTHESASPVEQKFLKRMTSNSLEQALNLAVNELKSQHGLITDLAGNDLAEGGECSDGEDSDRNYFENDSWNGNAKLQTAIFKGNLQSSENNELSSDVESAPDEVIGMDGFYPIIYSEDNASQGEAIGTDSDNEVFGNGRIDSTIEQKEVSSFDEKPIQSKIGQDVMSFEDLVENQLEAEKKSNINTTKPENHLVSKKKFLRKGEGTARFVGGLKADQRSKVGYTKGSKGSFLPERSLKLKAETPLKDRKFTESAVNFEQVSDELNLKKDVRAVRQMAMESSTRQDFPIIQPLSRSSVGFQRHNNVTHVDSSIEMSFQKMLESRNIDEKMADEELAEFELLEKEALDTSMSSNSSSVMSLVAANKSSNVNLNTSSPIQKAFTVDRDIKPGNAVNQRLDVSNDSMSSVEEFGNNEGSSKSELGSAASIDRLQAFDRNAPVMKYEGNDVKEDQFSDDSEWDDTIRSSDAIDDGNSTIVSSPKSKTAPDANLPQSTKASPPTSQLMKKFFPKLDTKEKVGQQDQNTTKKIQNGKQKLNDSKKENLRQSFGKENVPPSTQSSILKSKLTELESEISRFKKENTVLETLRVEKEKELMNLKNEVQQFEKKRAEELEQIEKFRDEEMQKLRREKKTFEKYQKAVRSAPNKKEREEIEALKQELNQLQEDIKRRETRWNGSAARFRKRIEDLENENYELKESIKLLEKERLQKWGKTENKSLEVKERITNKLPADDVKQVVNGIMVRSDSQKPQQCVDHGLERNPISRKTKSNPKKSISPRDEIGKTRIVGKGDVNPRMGVAPYEQPEVPREPRTDDSSTGGSTEKVNVRLSLTPERKQPSVEKIVQGNAHMKHQDGKVERILPDGSREITFPNGTRKIVDPTGQHIVVSFFNGDIKQIFPDDRTIYFYAESKTTHTTYSDGTELFEFSNGQSEKHYPDGRKVITFHDQTVKCIFGNGAEETVFADGTIQNVDTNGQRTISFPNGQREIHTQNFKRREYPDGTVKTVYQDGRQETRYSTGRIRIKDQFGNVTLDTGLS